jgi:hypothetical protein
VPHILATLYDDAQPTDELDKNMRTRSDGWLFFETGDTRLLIRALLDACHRVRTISLDVSDLIQGGWLEDQKICDVRRKSGALECYVLEPTVIMAEGDLRH